MNKLKKYEGKTVYSLHAVILTLILILAVFCFYPYCSKSKVEPLPEGLSFSGYEGQSDFRAKVLIAAVNLYPETGILPSILFSQAVLESGHGQLCQGNNIFGIKAGNGWEGATVTHISREHLPTNSHGQSHRLIRKVSKSHSEYEIIATFRAYPTIEASILDYCKLIQGKPRYNGICGATSSDAMDIIAKSGYATDVKYTSKLKSICKRYNTESWDAVALMGIRLVVDNQTVKK